MEQGWAGVEEIDLRGLEEAEGEKEAQRVVEEEAGRAFDLARGPLLRVKLVQMGEEEHVLVVTMHHIVSDGWSTGVMVRELLHYMAFTRGAGHRCRSWRFSMRIMRCGSGVAAGRSAFPEEEYWRKQLEGAEHWNCRWTIRVVWERVRVGRRSGGAWEKN